MMVNICDRCGAPVGATKNPDYLLKKWIGDPRYPYEAVDLCQDCQNKLNFIVQKFILGEDVVVKALDWERKE